MIAVASPAIAAEMVEWVARGGKNSGIVGAYDGTHPTGFHRAAFEVSTKDYSRRHEPGRPFNMTWSCAGDFSHGGRADLRALHAQVLARLMAGDPALSMICEFIGQPWAGKPVYYWARWLGVSNLKRYTGKGHDHWSHISWWRSRANERAFLWRAPVAAAPPASPVVPKPGGTNMLVIGRETATGRLWLSDGVRSRLLPPEHLADVRWLASQGAIGPLWNGGAIWEGWAAGSFGAIDGGSATEEQWSKLLAVVAARPDTPLSPADVPAIAAGVKQALREGLG